MSIPRRTVLAMMAGAAAAPVMRPAATNATQREAAARDAASLASSRPDPWIELSAANLEWNLLQIQQRVKPTPVMAVVKANAYGHGLVEVSRALAAAGINDFLVGKLDEARAMRAAGIRGRILNFGPFTGSGADSDAEEIVRLGVSQNLYAPQAEALSRAAARVGRRALVHIKVDTGLGRFGVHHERALEFIERASSLSGITIDGVFTTLTEDAEFDVVQLERLRTIAAACAKRGIKPGVVHAASSAAILDFPAACQLDFVRPGIMLYGLYPSMRAEKERQLDLRPVLSFKTRVAQAKTLAAGESVGYHRAFVAQQPERVATLAAGYSDGLPRGLVGKGDVLISGRRCRILAISANAAVLRLGDAPAAAGDEAVLLGAQGGESITAAEIGAHTGASVYAVAMELSALLPRVTV